MNNAPSNRKPSWLKLKINASAKQTAVEQCIEASGLHTVCKEARCPNRNECFSQGTATFLVMGSVCTRTCSFCTVTKAAVEPLDWTEITRVTEAVIAMHLRHVVITSVTRDDLPDGGAVFFAELVASLRKANAALSIELLIPDLKGDKAALATVINAKPDIFNHNIETVPRLYPKLRPQAVYERSLAVLRQSADAGCVTKSGIMVGLGETSEEIKLVLTDLYRNGCSIATIGQYLQPSASQIPVFEYVAPETFEKYKEFGEKLGFSEVVAGPFVRSSYHAAESMQRIKKSSPC